MNLPLFANTHISGEVQLTGGHIRVTVHASAASLLLVGGMAGVLILGGLHVFLRAPALGTACLGAVFVAGGTLLAQQITKARHEVVADAAHILGTLARGERTTIFPV